MINSYIELASRNIETGHTVVTFVVRYPRPLLCEVNTHGALAKNTSSSRAVPAKTMRRKVMEHPFVPWHIGANQKGMQAGEELSGWRFSLAQLLYTFPLFAASASHYALEKLGVHKQIGNRLLEPWAWVEQVITATDWDNFFFQRNHRFAEPHLHELAAMMHGQYNDVISSLDVLELLYVAGHSNRAKSDSFAGFPLQLLSPGEWHLPFINEREKAFHNDEDLARASAARAARVSFFMSANKPIDNELNSTYAKLVEGLQTGDPVHYSPMEHPCMALYKNETRNTGRLKGFLQLRKMMPGESGEDAMKRWRQA